MPTRDHPLLTIAVRLDGDWQRSCDQVLAHLEDALMKHAAVARDLDADAAAFFVQTAEVAYYRRLDIAADCHLPDDLQMAMLAIWGRLAHMGLVDGLDEADIWAGAEMMAAARYYCRIVRGSEDAEAEAQAVVRALRLYYGLELLWVRNPLAVKYATALRINALARKDAGHRPPYVRENARRVARVEVYKRLIKRRGTMYQRHGVMLQRALFWIDLTADFAPHAFVFKARE